MHKENSSPIKLLPSISVDSLLNCHINIKKSCADGREVFRSGQDAAWSSKLGSNLWPSPATGPAQHSLSECLNSGSSKSLDSLCGAPAEPGAANVKVSLQPDEWPVAFCSLPPLSKDHAEILLFYFSEICQIKSLPSLSHAQKAQTLKHFTDPVRGVFLSFLKYY